MKPTLIVDADDTLWENNIYYERCIADFAELMQAQNFDREEAIQTMNAVEEERIPVVGYAPAEFARSLVITYERLCERHDRPVEDAVCEAVRSIGQTVVDYPIELLDGVEEALERLSSRYRLLLLTKGDRVVQREKLARSGLEHLFDAVHVVHEKNAEVFRELLARYDLHPEQTWMVGNSPRSDVNPALEAGIGAIYVPYANTWNWEREAISDPEQVIVVDNFGELIELFVESEEKEVT